MITQNVYVTEGTGHPHHIINLILGIAPILFSPPADITAELYILVSAAVCIIIYLNDNARESELNEIPHFDSQNCTTIFILTHMGFPDEGGLKQKLNGT